MNKVLLRPWTTAGGEGTVEMSINDRCSSTCYPWRKGAPRQWNRHFPTEYTALLLRLLLFIISLRTTTRLKIGGR